MWTMDIMIKVYMWLQIIILHQLNYSFCLKNRKGMHWWTYSYIPPNWNTGWLVHPPSFGSCRMCADKLNTALGTTFHLFETHMPAFYLHTITRSLDPLPSPFNTRFGHEMTKQHRPLYWIFHTGMYNTAVTACSNLYWDLCVHSLHARTHQHAPIHLFVKSTFCLAYPSQHYYLSNDTILFCQNHFQHTESCHT